MRPLAFQFSNPIRGRDNHAVRDVREDSRIENSRHRLQLFFECRGIGDNSVFPVKNAVPVVGNERLAVLLPSAGFSAKFVQLKKNARDGEWEDLNGNDGLAPETID